jgi:SSS family solute:Na+ symporter
MLLSFVDICIIVGYILLSIFIGFWSSRAVAKNKNLEGYFLGGKELKWYWLGFSNSSGMFDINGAAWRVAMLLIYGLQSVWIPWIWPVWNQVFVMVFLAVWIRRSGVMTGAEWINFRFGDGKGARLSHMIIVVFAVVTVVVAISYFFKGIGPFAARLLPWDLSFSFAGLDITNAESYSLLICLLTTLYTIKGGMYSVVATEVIQFGIMIAACVLVTYFAVTNVPFASISKVIPDHWFDFWPQQPLKIKWTEVLPFADKQIIKDGYNLMGALVLMMTAKGVLSSLAGPVPGFDMQRILSTKTPKDAARMSWFTMLVLFTPLYLLVGGLTMIAIHYLMPYLQAQEAPDFEQVLSIVVSEYLPVGVKGIVLAGLLAAFMSTFSAFVNAAPAYLVNDLYKKYINPHASQKIYLRYSYIASFLIVALGLILGFFIESLNSITVWITSALYGGYAAANALKWVWWRLNGYGFFFGMLSGMIAALAVPPLLSEFVGYFFAEYVTIAQSAAFPLYAFFVIFLISTTGAVLGSLFTEKQDEHTLKEFYHRTNPWGFWKPVAAMVASEHADFIPNRNFKKDALNVLVGISWQMSMIVFPLAALFHQPVKAMIAAAVFILASIWLKYMWYDKMPEY